LVAVKRPQNVFAVVKHQEQAAWAQRPDHGVDRRLARFRSDPDRRAYVICDQAPIRERRELRQPHAITKIGCGALRDAQRQARLADSTSASQRQEPRLRLRTRQRIF
jgi:hypothetical protein